MEKNITGKVWKFGDNVDTDQIIPAEYLVTGDPKELAKHAFEKVRPEFAKEVNIGDIIVAGDNFGSGSSREHAPRALIGAGISCVIAKSFARIFYRNSINIGLPLIECDVDANDGDTLSVDFENGKIKNIANGLEYSFNSLPPFLLNLLEKGLIEYTKEKLQSTS
ncbi:MAG TPA: 3-isopropylmalate dehydratase small subunit [Methanosarcinales archaeon]|nr:3-isopropylmalate dehydratase small subunit [Methanosarcinales archaeon]